MVKKKNVINEPELVQLLLLSQVKKKEEKKSMISPLRLRRYMESECVRALGCAHGESFRGRQCRADRAGSSVVH